MKAIKSYLIDFWLHKDPDQSKKINSIITYVLPIVCIHFTLYKGLCWISTIPFDSYYNDNISFELLKRVFQNPYLLVFFVATVAFFRKKLFIPWTSFEKGNTVKLVVFITAAILAWYYSTYNYNFYFNQSHVFDRVALVILACAIYWRPLFILPFITLLFSIIWQFESFLGYPTAASPFLLTRVLILFLAFYIYKLIFKRFELSIFLFLLCCLIGTHYFTPAFGKLNSEWIFNDHINYLLAATYANGWLSFFDALSISKFIGFLDHFNVPLRALTLTIECGVLFFFLHLKYIRSILISAIFMHLGIFLYSGIFFWMWIILLLTILTFLLKKDLPINNIFNRYYFITGFLLIGLGKFWASSGGLNWHDSPLSYSYIIEAKTEDGEIVKLPPNFFSSYQFQFVVSDFKYLNEEKRLPIQWGATDNFTSNYLNTERSKKEIFNYEKEWGKVYQKDASKKEFIDFITTFISNRNQNLAVENDFHKYIKAPALYWTFPYNSAFKVNKKITALTINEITTYYTKIEGYREIRTKEMLNLKIDL
ncbi:hypothetical protein [Winogradskyella schleiferi]|uniref:hypothetical protein n=1 Tax=Winogradskyella schleiferi TaxID=2686078 RepID=UPI0015B952A7|nr:hypothetical protein [Winogradskyella schleiferi]